MVDGVGIDLYDSSGDTRLPTGQSTAATPITSPSASKVIADVHVNLG